LLALAMLVIFWLPGKVTTPPGGNVAAHSGAAAASPPTDVPANPPGAPAASGATPWDDAQQARLRKEAQDVLETLLDTQFALQERGVEHWAAEAFESAGTLAALADGLYRSRDYPGAAAGYREALTALQAIESSIPQVIEDLLSDSRDALEASDAPRAASLLEGIARIQPEHADLPALRMRLEAVPAMIPLLAEADALEDAGDLAAAELRLRQAGKLDPQHQGAARALSRVAAALEEQRFTAAMSDGYAALDAARYSDARRAFRKAAQLRPKADEAASALAEVAAAETASELASLRRVGRQYEDRERWQAALEAYQRALKTDNSLLFAQEGLARVSPRVKLDTQLRAVLDQPQRLADPAVAADTAMLLEQAKGISPAGPLLAEQITTLQRLLERANTPVALELRSDGLTEVTVLKVARLGRFQEQRVSLRPGRYTAVGSRIGFRDVRLEFEVDHSGNAGPVTIACTEPI
ncbi:MAG: hypothetical protein KDI09_16070, partial [Halioglobus sp.]|nr:hypothetical protein [Halioglobus sp.]